MFYRKSLVVQSQTISEILRGQNQKKRLNESLIKLKEKMNICIHAVLIFKKKIWKILSQITKYNIRYRLLPMTTGNDEHIIDTVYAHLHVKVYRIEWVGCSIT